MANISLDLHTLIAQNLPKYSFQSSLDYTFLSLKPLDNIGMTEKPKCSQIYT